MAQDVLTSILMSDGVTFLVSYGTYIAAYRPTLVFPLSGLICMRAGGVELNG